MPWLTDPLQTEFFLRALTGGSLAAVLCALVGTWVVVRGLAFLGEALAHGMLPGVALAGLTGFPLPLGAAASAVVMTLGVGWVSRHARIRSDTAIGILFAGMLALGVLIVSSSRHFAVDITAILFGDILAVRDSEVRLLLVGLLIAVPTLVLGHRAFVSLAVDPSIAQTTGMRPRLAHVAQLALVTLAVVVSYQAVGTLLVVALLLAPAASARLLVVRLVPGMLLGAGFSIIAAIIGLYASWHLGVAAGAAVAASAVGIFLVCLLATSIRIPPTTTAEPSR